MQTQKIGAPQDIPMPQELVCHSLGGKGAQPRLSVTKESAALSAQTLEGRPGCSSLTAGILRLQGTHFIHSPCACLAAQLPLRASLSSKPGSESQVTHGFQFSPRNSNWMNLLLNLTGLRCLRFQKAGEWRGQTACPGRTHLQRKAQLLKHLQEPNCSELPPLWLKPVKFTGLRKLTKFLA